MEVHVRPRLGGTFFEGGSCTKACLLLYVFVCCPYPPTAKPNWEVLEGHLGHAPSQAHWRLAEGVWRPAFGGELLRLRRKEGLSPPSSTEIENCSGCLKPDSCPCPKAIRRSKKARQREENAFSGDVGKAASSGRRALLASVPPCQELAPRMITRMIRGVKGAHDVIRLQLLGEIAIEKHDDWDLFLTFSHLV